MFPLAVQKSQMEMLSYHSKMSFQSTLINVESKEAKKFIGVCLLTELKKHHSLDSFS